MCWQVCGDRSFDNISYTYNETELYYLQSRYYDPEVCRFINCDDVNYIGLTESEASYNPFAYCENEPVNSSDSSGSFGTPIQWACAIIGAIIGIPFGKWIANKLGYYSGWRYSAIRAAAVVGGAALGWFAGTKIIKLVKLYVRKNPIIFIRIASRYGINALDTFRYVFGLGNVYITKILLGSGFVSRFVAHLIVTADRVASGLKSDIYHRAASYLSESQLAKGKVYIINNGRKILLQVYGYLNGKRGVFEYIIDESGRVCHQLFKEGRHINGIPN